MLLISKNFLVKLHTQVKYISLNRKFSIKWILGSEQMDKPIYSRRQKNDCIRSMITWCLTGAYLLPILALLSFLHESIKTKKYQFSIHCQIKRFDKNLKKVTFIIKVERLLVIVKTVHVQSWPIELHSYLDNTSAREKYGSWVDHFLPLRHSCALSISIRSAFKVR